jgi:DNA modification methylase
VTVRILQGDCRDVLATLPERSVHCCVTSPPYFGLRDYGHAGQIGLEPTPAEYVEQMVAVFLEVRRVLRDDGTLWLNLGDSYANDGKWGGSTGGKHVAALHGDTGAGRGKRTTGLKSKDLIGIPWRVAFALQADGWYLRQDIIWSKPNPMPESVRDRCTKAHEYVFLLSKSERYHYDADAIAEASTGQIAGNVNPTKGSDDPKMRTRTGLHGFAERQRSKRDSFARAVSESPPPGQRAQHREDREESAYPLETRNKRSVWTIATQPFAEAHFATMAPELAETCIKAGCPEGGTVLDPFGGAGTTGLVADRLQRDALLIELNAEYIGIAGRRITGDAPLFANVEAAA